MSRVNMAKINTQALSYELLSGFARRSGNYDLENEFFMIDFEELRKARYLLLPVPEELGGLGMSLPEVCREQRRWRCPGPWPTTRAGRLHSANSLLTHEIAGKMALGIDGTSNTPRGG